MSRISPLIELYLRVDESRIKSFSKEDIYDIIREILPYEREMFNEAFESEEDLSYWDEIAPVSEYYEYRFDTDY